MWWLHSHTGHNNTLPLHVEISHVCVQITLMVGSVITLVTDIPDPFMLRLLVFCQITLISKTMITLGTVIPYTVMSGFYMPCQSTPIIETTFTLVTLVFAISNLNQYCQFR